MKKRLIFKFAALSLLALTAFSQEGWEPSKPSKLKIDIFSQDRSLKNESIAKLPLFAEIPNLKNIVGYIPFSRETAVVATRHEVRLKQKDKTQIIYSSHQKRAGLIEGIQIINEYLYIVTNSDGLLIYNISDNKWSRLSRANLLLSDNIHRLQKKGDRIALWADNVAYFWDNTHWMCDFSYPRFTRQAIAYAGNEISGSFTGPLQVLKQGEWTPIKDSGNSINRLLVASIDGRDCLIAACSDGLRIYDKELLLTQHLLQSENILDVIPKGNRLFVLSRTGGLYVYFIKNKWFDNFNTNHGIADAFLKSMSICGNEVYIVGGSGKIYKSNLLLPEIGAQSPQPAIVFSKAPAKGFQNAPTSEINIESILSNRKFNAAESPVVYLGEDRNTGGYYSTHYKSSFGLVCAVSPPHDLPINNYRGEEGFSITGSLEKHSKASDSLRSWASPLPEDALKDCYIRIPDYQKDFKLSTYWDDHGEAYPISYDGPNILIDCAIPQKVTEVALFFACGNRDFAISILSPDKQQELLKVRVNKFENGKYCRFLVDGGQLPKFFIRIHRLGNLNANVSGIFLMPIDDKTIYDLKCLQELSQVTFGDKQISISKLKGLGSLLRRELVSSLMARIISGKDTASYKLMHSYLHHMGRDRNKLNISLPEAIGEVVSSEIASTPFDSKKPEYIKLLSVAKEFQESNLVPVKIKKEIWRLMSNHALEYYKAKGFHKNHNILAFRLFRACPEALASLREQMAKASEVGLSDSKEFEYQYLVSLRKLKKYNEFKSKALPFISKNPDYSGVKRLQRYLNELNETKE